jgi:subtilase family serine protease
MRICKLLLPLLATTLSFAAQPDRILTAINANEAVALPRSVHPNAQPQYDQGAVDPATKLGYITILTAPSPSQQQALDQLLAQQQNPKSPNFHKWLTPAQFADRFGLSQNDLNKVTAWLKSQGFQILSTGGGRNAIIFSGTAGQVQTAFGTQIHGYKVDGENHIANSTPIMIPAALNGIVNGMIGLHDFRLKPMYVRTNPALRPHPDYTTAIGSSTVYFLAPGDVATLYDLYPLFNMTPTAINGAGQELAIVGQTDIYGADLAGFRKGFNLPRYACTSGSTGVITSCNSTYFSYVLVGTDPGQPSLSDLSEADIDIEWSGAVARNAQIIYVNGETNGGVFDALQAAINPPSGPPLAPVISMSYGGCEFANFDIGFSVETLLSQGYAEGISIMIASGDAGSATCDRNPPGGASATPPFSPAEGGAAVAYPASSQYVTAVGGTSIPLADFTSSFWGSTSQNGLDGGSALSTLVGQEITWNDDEAIAELCTTEADPLQDSRCNIPGFYGVGVVVTSAQTAQEDYWIRQGGGGVSNCTTLSGGICQSGFPRPTYQQNLNVPGLPTGASNARMVPDVSMLASPDYPGYIVCTPVEELSSTAPYDTEASSSCANGIATAADGTVSGSEFVIDPSVFGGTSVASPVFAGIVTLLNQYLQVNGYQSTAVGPVNTMLYKLAAQNSSNHAFHQITSGDNDVYCAEGDPSGQPADVICPSSGANPGVVGFSTAHADATTGYNLAAGLGSVDANNLFTAWGDALPGFSVAPSPATISAKAGQTTNSATVTATPRNGFSGTVTFSCSGLPSGATCNFSPSATSNPVQVTVTTAGNMAAGSSTFNVVGTSSSLTSSTTITLNLTASGYAFQMATSPAGASLSIQPGQMSGNTMNLVLTDSGSTGFIVTNGGNQTTVLPLTYTCNVNTTGGGPVSGASCAVSPVSPTSVINPSVSVTTQAPTAQLQLPFAGSNRIFYAMVMPGLLGILFVGSGRRKRGLRLLSLMVVLGFSTLWLGACSGSNPSSNQNPGTPAGTYAVNISATTGGSAPVQSTVSFTLTVQ